jgi:predicted TIM-barrel fold metal-dependent hydrolase
MLTVAVDCHSHIFNAEDIPLDGFLKRRLPLPSILTGVFSVPLDAVTAWVAPGSRESSRLVAMICAAVSADTEAGLESVSDESAWPDPAVGTPLISDDELDRRLVQLFPIGPATRDEAGLESVGDVEDQLAVLVAAATPEQHAALDSWARTWGEDDLAAPPEAEGLEGPVDDIRRKVEALRRAARLYKDALHLITRHRHMVMSELASTYSDVRLFIPALVDFDHTTRDKPATPVREQVAIHSLVSKLSAVGGIPLAPEVRVHPFVAFCPYREVEESELADWDIAQGTRNPYIPFAEPSAATDADRFSNGIEFDPARAKPLNHPVGPWCSATLDLSGVTRSLDIVRHAVELGGFAGVKLYPPSGFVPLGNIARFGERRGARLDAALRALYAYCERLGVPILTHASHSNGFEDGYDDLASPEGWRQVLVEYPQLRLCLGHFGHLYGVGDSSQPSANSWPARFLALMDDYDHVYADVGCSRYAFDGAYRARFDAFLRVILGPREGASDTHKKRRRRLMFGSDYWMNTLAPDHGGALESFTTAITRDFGDEAVKAFRGGNALRWLGFTGEDDKVAVNSLSRARLLAFYGEQQFPSWLIPEGP